MAAETRWLERIVGAKRAELERTRAELPQSVLEKKIAPRSPGAFRQALLDRAGTQPELAVIAELKQASPSRGTLCDHYDPPAIARSYQQAGASALSVLTRIPSPLRWRCRTRCANSDCRVQESME